MRGIDAIALLLLTASLAQAKSITCATCHVKEAASQPATPMANALPTAGHNPVFQANKDLRFTSGSFSYEIATKGGATTYAVTDGKKTIALPIHWVFGAAAQTYVLERDGKFFESMVSYYPEIGGLDITVGDQDLHPQTIDEAIGRKLETEVITSCFGCHSTSSITNRKFDLASLIPGVTCERCHAGASAHLAAMSHSSQASKTETSQPERLGKKSAESISNFCGQCHRSWETVVRNNWRGESNVRFQPYRLANSRCFNGTDSRISCLACHNQHQGLAKEQAGYDAKCLACHDTRISKTASSATPRAKACLISDSLCTSCHMPKVQLPGGHQTFTDHRIRVVRAGAVYPD